MKGSYRPRRHRNTHQNNEQQSEKPFFSKSHDVEPDDGKVPFFQTGVQGGKGLSVQPKLAIGQPGDAYEREADAVADSVVNRNANTPAVQQKEISSIQRADLATPQEDEKLGTAEARMEKDKLIQEKPDVQMQTTGEEEEPVQMQEMQEEEPVQMQAMEEEEAVQTQPAEEEEPVQMQTEEEEEPVQAKSDGPATASPRLSGRIKDSSRKGSPLPENTRAEMESSIGHDFSQVNVHTGSDAVEMNKELGAQAFTHGSDIYFNQGKFNPDSTQGKRLLAHELTHTVQQGGAEVKREQLGSAFSHTAGVTSPYSKITGSFDGRNFSLMGDGSVLMTVSAQSGRPYSVRARDARTCGGSVDESYTNNPKYVGISDNGPIPEGEYRFRATRMATFSFSERTSMLAGGQYTDPFGRSLHGGDWGSGRVPLAPVRILPGPRGCGSTRRRSGFYLHGGIMPGSSGCIDIGNSGFDSLVQHLQGYRGTITIKVRYPHIAPDVGAVDRALGRFTYPEGENPTLWDRVRSIFSTP